VKRLGSDTASHDTENLAQDASTFHNGGDPDSDGEGDPLFNAEPAAAVAELGSEGHVKSALL
jgi:hypothetical protein